MILKSLKIGIVVGEASGDILGASLIQAIKKYYPHLKVEGVVGPRMIEQGCDILYPIEKLSVMGFIEPLKHLFEILHIRRQLKQHFLNNPPDIFIGIDAPDFNLSLEEDLKKAGIYTVHYVSPSVWAWRKKRIHKIKRAVNLMLTLFPFETAIYEQHKIPVQFVGHSLADQIEMEPDQRFARRKLGLRENEQVLALLPGSRKMEIKYLAKIFIKTAQYCLSNLPNLKIVAGMFNAARRQEFEKILKKIDPALSISIYEGNSKLVMQAADAVLLASGTVTLEAMLLKKPMVVAYRMAWLNYWIARCLIHIDYFSLPNLIAKKTLVPELLQSQASPNILGPLILRCLTDEFYIQAQKKEFVRLHHQLQCHAADKAAKSILKCFHTS